MSIGTPPAPATRFALPPGAEPHEPPERRGLARDGVRLLVARPGGVSHRRFHDLPGLLRPGDLLVVNTSATLPAALTARRADGTLQALHVSTALDDRRWVVEPRRADGRGPDPGAGAGVGLTLPGGVRLVLERPFPAGAAPGRLWTARVDPPTALAAYLGAHGRPIAYRHLTGEHRMTDHQTVYATEAGSAEMPSAGRPFTAPLLVRLMAAGVVVAPVVLHAGVSSPEAHEPPAPERMRVPPATARLVDATRRAGGRVVAVGTTAVRALESAADAGRTVRPHAGWTSLVLGPARPARVVTGLITGLHEPGASHLLLLEAVAGEGLVGEAYAAAVAAGYLWHEFGDSMLLLPEADPG